MNKWGNGLWHVLYIIAKNLKTTFSNLEKKLLEMFFKSIQGILPCTICRNDYNQYIKNNPPIFDNKEMVIDWLYNLDNKIKGGTLDKTDRLNSMGDTLNKSRFSLLLCDLSSYYYLNAIHAESIYIFLVYCSILLPDKEYNLELRRVLDCQVFTKKTLDAVIKICNVG